MSRPEREGMLGRLAGFSYRHRWSVLLTWIVLLVGSTALASVVGSAYHHDVSLPGTESQRAADTLERGAPDRSGDSIQVVFHDPAGIAEGEARDRIEKTVSELSRLPHVNAVSSPFAAGESAVSQNGEIGYSTLTLDAATNDVPTDAVSEMIEVAQAGAGNGLQVELGGDAVRSAQESGGGAAEGAGMLAALVILVILFGSLVAASLPLITAIFAVGTTLAVIVGASHLTSLADFTPPLMMLVGLGVGIDYALLVFTRYREELAGQGDRELAVHTALDTAGRSVLFAGMTVIFALLGLYALGLAALQGIALAVALTVLMTMLASLTLLPALLHLLGRRLERRPRRKGRREGGELWRRWSEYVMARPWPALIVSGLILAALIVPALDMRLGFSDAGNDSTEKTSKRAYDLLSEGFGPGFNGPFVVVAESDEDAAHRLTTELAATPGIAAALPPAGGDGIHTVIAFPDSKPQDEATTDLLHSLRDDVLPGLEAETGGEFMVGGPTAANLDFTDKVAERMPVFLLVVVGLSMLLLTIVFRSALIPLKAAVLNLITIGASLGIITLVFNGSGPIESFVPVMIFAIVFGLSMDYEVFLVSRMHEEWEKTGDPRRAVSTGLISTGQVITAAAAIMIVVFGAFALSPDRMLQQFGLGLAAAILIDAFIVRCLIVPAVMRLLGSRAWWLPGPIDRVLPRITLEPPSAEPERTRP